ncbi:XkdX family protein [Furfurilactobacillus sp. WILCCON 0119]
MTEFIKLMAAAGCDITEYVELGTITPAQYTEFTGKQYD